MTTYFLLEGKVSKTETDNIKGERIFFTYIFTFLSAKDLEKSMARLRQIEVEPTAGYILVKVHNVTEKNRRPDF